MEKISTLVSGSRMNSNGELPPPYHRDDRVLGDKVIEINKERFGFGDSLSSISAATGPSDPIYVDKNKVVFLTNQLEKTILADNDTQYIQDALAKVDLNNDKPVDTSKSVDDKSQPNKKPPTQPKTTGKKAPPKEPKAPKPKAAPKTMYWGVDLTHELPKLHKVLEKELKENADLIPLTEIHSTLLFVGKKPTPNEDKYFNLEGKMATLEITGFGLSEDAIAMDVKSIKLSEDDTVVPTHAEKQHITMALSKGTKAKDSVLTLLNDPVMTIETLTLTGKIHRYL